MHPKPSDDAVFKTQAHVIVAVVGVHPDQDGPLGQLILPLEEGTHALQDQ
jgi:hypothetical protein